MLKYKTLDQHVVYKGKYIEPDTEVEIPDDDVHIWEELVDLKVAVRVAEPKEATADEGDELAALEEAAQVAEPPEGAADEEQDKPAPPSKGRKK